MRFTVVGHAALFIETSAGSILADPWLFGSCDWRSWRHHPPAQVRPEHLSPDDRVARAEGQESAARASRGTAHR